MHKGHRTGTKVRNMLDISNNVTAREHMILVRESHETPSDVEAALTSEGGLNRFGRPMYRAVWSNNRLDWIAGEFTNHDHHGNYLNTTIERRHEPKYFDKPNRWIIEKWVSPETYGSPDSWRDQTREIVGVESVEALGPYPQFGDYECALVLEAKGQFVQITPSIAREFVRRVHASEIFRAAERRASIRSREDKKRTRISSEKMDILSDVSPFNKGSYTVVPANI
jgi:hypothetical protein